MSSSPAISGAAIAPRSRPVLQEAAFASTHGVLTGRLRVPCDLPIFAGHFQAMPVVPGVVQLGWVAELAQAHSFAAGQLAGLASATFRRVLQPDVELQFELKARDFVVACGRLGFGHSR